LTEPVLLEMDGYGVTRSYREFVGSPCRFCTFSFDVWVEQQ
jgi:hypothetical protein